MSEETESVQGLAERFSAARPRLVRVAYAILGSHSEAEDVVAESWLRLVRANEAEAVRDVEAWGTVAVARGALDVYRSARRRRETYVGPWLPEPVVDDAGPGAPTDPADRVTLDDSVSFALLVVLESLSPAERTSWVLHDLFGLPFGEVAAAVGRTPDAVRQLATRARSHLRERSPRFSVDAGQHRRAVDRFLAATAGGRIADLLAVLDPDVELVADGGGVVSAARRPVVGADRVARFVLGLVSKSWGGDELRVVSVNGLTGIGHYRDGELAGVVSFDVDDDDRITRIDIVRAPDKLR